MRKQRINFLRRRRRTRFALRRSDNENPRLSIHRTNQHIYAQVIDDITGKTIAAASTLEKSLREAIETGSNKEAATLVGETIARRALAVGVRKVLFDRGGFLYHGRVQALADSARINGLVF